MDAAAPVPHDAGLTRWKLALGLAAFAALLVSARLLGAADLLERAAAWCRAAGATGVAAFAGLYVVTTLLLWPAAILTVAAGSIYGLLWGAILVHAVSVVADFIPFVIARRAGRARFQEFLARRDPRGVLARLGEATARRGFAVVCLIRLSPLVPFNVMNYLFGLTRVRASTYVVASTLASLPNTVLFVYLGAAAAAPATVADPSGALFWAGLAITAACAVILHRIARRIAV